MAAYTENATFWGGDPTERWLIGALKPTSQGVSKYTVNGTCKGQNCFCRLSTSWPDWRESLELVTWLFKLPWRTWEGYKWCWWWEGCNYIEAAIQVRPPKIVTAIACVWNRSNSQANLAIGLNVVNSIFFAFGNDIYAFFSCIHAVEIPKMPISSYAEVQTRKIREDAVANCTSSLASSNYYSWQKINPVQSATR